MRCAWNELLSIIPQRIRADVNQIGKENLQELRLRINAPPELVLQGEQRWLNGTVTTEELHFVINTASRYSPWSAATMRHGYITAQGGHRIGLCGEVICKGESIEGMREVHSLCIRVARDFTGLADKRLELKGSFLILGAPGWGKTTLLRDWVRILAEKENICVIDERGELFPEGFFRGKRVDVLTGCPKASGIEMALRTMGPDCIAVDEITADGDCQAIMHAANCGVRLAATAHASSIQDFMCRKTYRPLIENHVFDTIFLLKKDKSYRKEVLIRCSTSGSAQYS